MSNEEAKKQYIRKRANELSKVGKSITAKDLADELNKSGLETSYGTPFQGGRGTYMLIRATYRWLDTTLGSPEEASHVARAFTKPDGRYAYEV